LAGLAAAQEPFQLYSTDNGLPNNSILAILQARDGYLWFTTYLGIVRFDGVRFQVFDGTNTPAIRGTTFAIFCLMQDHTGAIWAGAWNGGAIRYYNGRFTSITTKDGLPNNQVTRIDEDEQGTIWFYSESSLSRLRDGKVEIVHTIDGEPVRQFVKPPPNLGGETRLFGLWRMTRGRLGIQRFAYGKWSDLPLPSDVNPATVRITVEAEDSKHRLWYNILDRPHETHCVQDGRLTSFKGLPARSIGSYQDRFGRLWITDKDGHSSIWQDGRATPLSGISSPSPLRVLEDREGSFWVGTLNQGLAHALPQVIRSVRLPGGPAHSVIHNLTQDSQGDIWIGSFGLTRMRGGRFKVFPVPAAMAKWPSDQEIFALWADPDGTIFFSNNTGPKMFRNGKFLLPDLPLQQVKTRVNAIIRDRAGNLWMGNSDGVFRYRDSSLTAIQAAKGLKLRGEVRSIVEDRAGTVWIGTDAVLCRFRREELSCFGSNDPLTNWRVRSVFFDAQGVGWVSTAGNGLLRIENDEFRWILAKDGLYSNNLSGLVEDANGNFWVASRTGIFRVSKQELNAYAHGRAHRVTSSYFGKDDGLIDSDCAGFGQPRGFVAKDGTIWFPTADGVAVIDPRKIPINNAPPPVEIQSCTLEQQPIPCDNKVFLPPGAGHFEINYTALSLIRSDQIQFRYRLEGLDKTWVAADRRRTAYYPHLKPGTYKFQVTATNSFGVWNTETTELTITAEPHYYQTLWFRLSGFGSVIVIFALMWRMREIRYTKRQAMQRAFAQQVIASQETERKRIAGELHDSLGQRLALIKNLALLMNRPSSRSLARLAEALAGETTQAIAEVRSISRNLRPYQLDLLGLTKAIEVLVKSSCEAADIRAEVVLDELANVFDKEAEIHLYRIVQECLGNAIKHGKPTEITVTIQRSGSGVSLVVTDNGVGFDPSHTNGDRTTGGFGLTGISERAMLLGGKASVQSARGQGTTVTIKIAATDATAPIHLGQREEA
jgi:signal transduction histidine kinase/ligand-binding sensor domain-containing protein